ncbi:MAG: hypothetical protein AABZ60_00940 [Planctomycetota bacterium]
MTKKRLALLILLLWIGTMGYFLYEEVFPPPSEGYKPQIETLKTEERKEEFSIYFGNQRIGEIQTLAKRNADGTYQVSNQTNVNMETPIPQEGLAKNVQKMLNFIGLPGLQFKLKSQVDIDQNFQLKQLSFSLDSNSLNTQISGAVKDDILKIDIQQSEALHHLDIPYQSTETIPHGLLPFERMENLKIGKHWKMRYINPITKNTELFDARVVDTEQLVIEDKIYDAFVVKMQQGFLSIKTWVAHDGTVLKVQLPFGLEIIREEIKHKANSTPSETPKEKK